MNGYVLASIAGLTIGLAFAIESKVIERLGNVQVMYIYRWMGAVLSIPLYFLAKDRRPVLQAKVSLWLLATETFLYAIAGWVMLLAMRKIGAPRAGVFEISYPIFTALFCTVLFNHKLTPWFYVGTAIMIAGASIIVLYDGP